MVNLVYNTRKDLKGDDVFRTIEEEIFRFTNDGESSFLQFHTTWAGDKNQLQRIIGFGHPKLMKKLKGSKHIFFDGTFKTTPKPFKQVWIIMVWDDEDDVYIPVMWILMTGQTAEHYLLALHNIVVAVGGQSPIAPRSATCDFEQAMINALHEKFGKEGQSGFSINGCRFHFKQACRGTMVELRIEDTQTTLWL